MYWELSKRTMREFLKDDCMHMAAGIAYYAFFSIFPLLLGLIAIIGVLLEPAEVQGRLQELVLQAFPASAGIVADNLEGVVASRGALGFLSLLGLLWSAMAVFAAIGRSLNRAWDLERQRPFLKQKLLELGMVGAVGLLLLVWLGATAFFRLAQQFLPAGLQPLEGGPSWDVATWLVPAAFSFGVFLLVYRFVPNTRITWGDVWPGALLAAALFEAGKNLFAWYLASFANYSLVYGSLGVIVAFLLWAYLSAVILLLGAEFTAEYARLFGSHSRRI
ncbi:MAG: YihY/virulence factor BrkB family protein [Dehalococcoidia bacterium]|nr:YihY/virulence factor BrkB family protein [Dehalococcoidia bacterium]